MDQPGLDGRHRDGGGEIGRKHGNTLVGPLRRIYGPGFAAGFAPATKLVDVLATLDEPSLTHLVRHHHEGTLETRISDAEVAGS